MSAKRGYYSLIQFCPDPSRAEAVNLGVLLFCPEAHFIAARTSAGNKAATKLVRREAIDFASLNAAKRAIERRLEIEREEFRTLEDLQRFVDTRANALRLTPPRPVKVFEPEQDLGKLFDELVGGRPSRRGARNRIPVLDTLFDRLQQEGRGRVDWTVTVPILDRELRVPYAFRNGQWNLVKPQTFAAFEARAVPVALRLAVEGDLLRRHGRDQDGEKRLVVVSSFEPSDDGREVEQRVRTILSEYQVTVVPVEEVPAFALRIEREAH